MEAWLRTHEAATRTAPTVQRLLDAGADMVGKTHTDELTFSLNGENAHYGTPVNVNRSQARRCAWAWARVVTQDDLVPRIEIRRGHSGERFKRAA